MERLLPIVPGCKCLTFGPDLPTVEVKTVKKYPAGLTVNTGINRFLLEYNYWLIDIVLTTFNGDRGDCIREDYLVRIDGEPENNETKQTEKPVTA